MASKVLVPTTPFGNLQIKKSPPESTGSGFIIGGGDAASRVAHLEHSMRFLQEQHRVMLSGLHVEIEALRERNRDLQFQLIFNKETSLKTSSPSNEESPEINEKEEQLKREITRLEREASAARGEARAAEGRALQLQQLVDAQTEKLRELESNKCECRGNQTNLETDGAEESRAELRARLAEAERLVRRLRGDAERQRRELQCMKNSLHASLRASGMDNFGYQNNYHFPHVASDFWREPLREGSHWLGRDYNMMAARTCSTRRPLALPELNGQQIHRSTVYANNHTRPRANGYESKHRKSTVANGDPVTTRSPEEPSESPRFNTCDQNLVNTSDKSIAHYNAAYPELKVVVTKLIPLEKVSASQQTEGAPRTRPRRHHHRKHATDQT